jgi:hypothetical protein
MKKHYKCRVIIDSEVIKKYKIYEPSQTAFFIMAHLYDPDGWRKQGYSFENVLEGEDILITLSLPETIEKKCGLPKQLSCAELGGRFIYLNSDRWFKGSKKSKLSLADYRHYMINHEMGHILGFEHTKCPCVGCKVPIMVQQTLGLQGCKPDHGHVR